MLMKIKENVLSEEVVPLLLLINFWWFWWFVISQKNLSRIPLWKNMKCLCESEDPSTGWLYSYAKDVACFVSKMLSGGSDHWDLKYTLAWRWMGTAVDVRKVSYICSKLNINLKAFSNGKTIKFLTEFFFFLFKLVNLKVRSNYMLHFLSYNYHIYNVLESSLQPLTSTVYIAVELRITLENWPISTFYQCKL